MPCFLVHDSALMNIYSPEVQIVIVIVFVGCDSVAEVHHKFIVIFKKHLHTTCKALRAYVDKVDAHGDESEWKKECTEQLV